MYLGVCDVTLKSRDERVNLHQLSKEMIAGSESLEDSKVSLSNRLDACTHGRFSHYFLDVTMSDFLLVYSSRASLFMKSKKNKFNAEIFPETLVQFSAQYINSFRTWLQSVPFGFKVAIWVMSVSFSSQPSLLLVGQ